MGSGIFWLFEYKKKGHGVKPHAKTGPKDATNFGDRFAHFRLNRDAGLNCIRRTTMPKKMPSKKIAPAAHGWIRNASFIVAFDYNAHPLVAHVGLLGR